MRVVAGTARGRRLVAPKGERTRPTSDRTREAVFNSLASLDAVRDAVFWDLWCGSGALGVEALSRGAARAAFVDRDPHAIAAARDNVETCGFGDRADLHRTDAMEFVRAHPEGTDVVLADPPYEFDRWGELTAALRCRWLVAESDRPIDPGPLFEVVRQRRYGKAWVTIGRRADVAQADAADG
jgi:16S rRNA (guanine966-N2)-methyltransferase